MLALALFLCRKIQRGADNTIVNLPGRLAGLHARRPASGLARRLARGLGSRRSSGLGSRCSRWHGRWRWQRCQHGALQLIGHAQVMHLMHVSCSVLTLLAWRKVCQFASHSMSFDDCINHRHHLTTVGALGHIALEDCLRSWALLEAVSWQLQTCASPGCQGMSRCSSSNSNQTLQQGAPSR